ncbi:small acid-soluble spore protein alpha/beta type [Paenibacillus cellulosilyticus]|uniref:Small acid-soluble spore protein alpha/beta type n=1 Tax=Paenibacillus cellulosilyticus TaxID=375489 RepID=A0A2V2Z3I4_9BACL|nr:alpha/beta-type small acid-soluble spore protein [Paenibacillus cellulosilyticus]PWW08370.1 small acid-soluble spore protein alpha/beta type [Paenibacillus cellulosilyticus]QKS47966.1 alpha/beta-type small acid-soluble spore protein [Paenibacillus cellulosilyticus]
MARSNRKVVPECRQALDQMKYEIAAELGLVQSSGFTAEGDTEFAGEFGTIGAASGSIPWRQLETRQAGAVGGAITRRLVQQAEAVLNGNGSFH